MTLIIEEKLCHHCQSGYRKNQSILTILIKLRDDIERALKSGEVTLAVFVHFYKALVTIDFNILIHKLHYIFLKTSGISILNYLSNRSHMLQIASLCSKLWYSKFGVSQWSILGPVLFNLCVIEELCSQLCLPPIRRRFKNILTLQSEKYKILCKYRYKWTFEHANLVFK